MEQAHNSRIIQLYLPEQEGQAVPDHMKREQQTALKDLMQNSHFQPLNDNAGPYEVNLSIEDNRMVLRMRNARAEDLSILVLSLKPYRRIIQDYFLMIESYEKARRESGKEKLEAIDMGRRGLHDEGAHLLIERLKDKVDMDFETARRFFTLICVLHKNNIRMLR